MYPECLTRSYVVVYPNVVVRIFFVLSINNFHIKLLRKGTSRTY